MKRIQNFITRKSKINPWTGIILAFTIIIPCLYLIINDIGNFNMEQIILIIGVIVLIKFTKNLIDKIIDTNDEYDIYD